MRSDAAARGAHPGLLGRWGSFVARRHRWFALAWLVVLLGAGYVSTADDGAVSDDFRVPGQDSQAAYDLLEERFASQNAASATVVFTAPEGHRLTDAGAADAVGEAVRSMERVRGVASVSDPLSTASAEQFERLAPTLPPTAREDLVRLARALPPSVSDDAKVAVATVTFTEPVTELLDRYPLSPERHAQSYENPYSLLNRSLSSALDGRSDGVRAYIGGPVADTWNVPVSWWANHADEVGLAIGALLLFVAFGSLFGMVIPIVNALFGAVTAGAAVYLLAEIIDVSSVAPPMTLMISIGVGLDYSLLIVTRYRQAVGDGMDPIQAAGRAMDTSGRAAVFAGLTVCVALLGLWLVPIPLVQTMGLAAAFGVAVMVLASCTLLPALLGFAGRRIDRVAINRRPDGEVPERSFWGRFATRMAERPWASLVGGTAVLLLLAAPFARIQFGMPGDGSDSPGLSQREAFVETERAFGAGRNGPLLVVVGMPEPVPFTEALSRLEPVSRAVGALEPAGSVLGVEYSVGPIPDSAERTTAVIYEVIPTSGPDSSQTKRLVGELRERLTVATRGTGMVAHVGGETATLIDLTELVTRYLPVVIGAVVLGAFLLLVLVFRSVLVPLKAAAMNLISIAAAYGVVVAVFQWGWGRQLIGLDETIPIVAFVPLVMFVVLFGLSMDYEVFLMSRIKEEWDRSGDPRSSVVRGVGSTGRVITTAALIMMAVFLSFVTNASPTLKLIGFGMAVAVLLDSTVVRMVLVPAAMELLGRRAWWFPRWLGWLPSLSVEGAQAPGISEPDARRGSAGYSLEPSARCSAARPAASRSSETPAAMPSASTRTSAPESRSPVTPKASRPL